MRIVKWVRAERSPAVEAVGEGVLAPVPCWDGQEVRTKGWGYRSKDRRCPNMTFQNDPTAWANSSFPEWFPHPLAGSPPS